MATSSRFRLPLLACSLFLLLFLLPRPSLAGFFDYGDALQKSLLYFEAQRSGQLPANQRVVWRGDSALNDGKSEGVDLQGGYYDAGDNVKYGFPMAYSMTMLAWGIVQYGQALVANGQLDHSLDALRWGTNYFIKAHSQPNFLWAEVGDGVTDHACWQRSEDMTTSRKAYGLDTSHPGSDQAGETAAAMAASALAFSKTDLPYSQILLRHARQLFTFADTYRGKYDDSITNARGFYNSVSGYDDELLWAAIWLYEATGEQPYFDYIIKNADSLGGAGWTIKELSWDVKYAGVQILASKILLEGKSNGAQNADVLQKYKHGAEFFICSLLRKNYGGDNAQFTPGGLLFTRPWNNMQYVTSASFALSVYSDYLSAAGQQLQCPGGIVPPAQLLSLAQSQVDYILGNNPMGMSYIVGYGTKFPQHVHHRGASIVSIKKNPSFVTCKGGYDTWYEYASADPNVLVGALVGGPDSMDHYFDDRTRYEQSEPTTSANGPLVGLLARFAGGAHPYISGPTPKPPTPTPRRPSTRPRPLPPRNTPPKHASPKPPALPLPVSSLHLTDTTTYNPGSPPTPLVDFQQIVTSSWTQGNQIYRRYEVKVTNISPGKLVDVKLASKDLTGSLYGMSKLASSSNLYTFPPWQSFSPHQTATFVYIQAGIQATFSLASYTTPSY